MSLLQFPLKNKDDETRLLLRALRALNEASPAVEKCNDKRASQYLSLARRRISEAIPEGKGE